MSRISLLTNLLQHSQAQCFSAVLSARFVLPWTSVSHIFLSLLNAYSGGFANTFCILSDMYSVSWCFRKIPLMSGKDLEYVITNGTLSLCCRLLSLCNSSFSVHLVYPSAIVSLSPSRCIHVFLDVISGPIYVSCNPLHFRISFLFLDPGYTPAIFLCELGGKNHVLCRVVCLLVLCVGPCIIFQLTPSQPYPGTRLLPYSNATLV